MKRAFVVALVLGLIACEPTTPVDAREDRRKTPAAIMKSAGPAPVTCPSSARVVKVGDHLQAKIDSAGRRGSLCFKPGTYRLKSALRPHPGQVLTFERGAVLNGSKLVKNWTKEGPYWVSGGHTQRFSEDSWLSAHKCDDNPAACVYEDLFMDDRPLTHVLSLGDLGTGEVYLDKSSSKMYIADDPSGPKLEATIALMGFDSAVDNVTIRGASIEKFGWMGLRAIGDSWLIENNKIRYVHATGLRLEGDGHRVQNNHLHHNGNTGLVATKGTDLIFQGNHIAYNNYLGFGNKPIPHHEGGVKMLLVTDVIVRNNHSHHNDGDGWWFDTNNREILIENNLFDRNTRHGLFYEVSFDATVRYNTIRNNGTVWDWQGAGILHSTSKNVEYYGNRIAQNVIRSVVILWEDRGQSEQFGEFQSANLVFRDNVIAFHNNFESWFGVYAGADPRVFNSNNRFEGNIYIVPNDGQRLGERWWKWEGNSLTWTEWRAYGFDAKGSRVLR